MNKKKVNVIDELIIENPGIETKKEGFPDIGKREDGKDYSFSVKKIEDAWYFNNSLYKIKTTNKVYKFGTGNPIKYKSFPCAVKTLKKQLNKNLYEYPPAAGDETHRQIISDYLKKEGFPNYIDFNNVIITNSTTEGFYLILKSIFKPNDVIIMTSPNYGLFAFMPERLNINVEVIQLKRENDYKIDPRELDSLIKSINNELKLKYDNKKGYVPKVRAFLNINPNNPIGNVLSDKDLKLLNSIGSVCKNNNVFIIDDLIYRDLTYDRKHLAKPIGTIKEYFNNTISLFGLSKSYNLAKTRTGFIVANEVVIRLIRNNVFYIMDSISVIQSSLLAGTFNNSKKRDKVYIKYFKDLIEKYEYSMNVCLALFDGIETIKNTKYYKKILKDIKHYIKDEKEAKLVLEGIPKVKTVVVPESGFFLLVDFTELKKYGIIKNEKELASLLYEKCGIRILIGQSFSWINDNEIIIRFSYSFESETLIKAISKINNYVRGVIK